MALTWTHAAVHSPIPVNAVYVGNDSDGAPIYVGRANHEGDLLPVKVIPSKNIAYASYDGREIPKYQYEILCGSNYTWVPSSHGNVPPNAMTTGYTTSGEPLYIGRGRYYSSLTPGKVHRSHGCLYIPFNGQEVRLDTYEVLVQTSTYVPSAPVAHYPADVGFIPGIPPTHVQPIYPSVPTHVQPIYPSVPTHVQPIYPSVPTHAQPIHPSVPKGGFDHVVHWMHCSGGVSIPGNAVFVGNDTNGDRIYVGRVHHGGDIIPGKVIPAKEGAYYCYDGNEIFTRNYELLTGSAFTWVHSSHGSVPENAVVGGHTSSGETLYIGRASYGGSLTSGKVHRSHGCLYIPYGDREISLKSYEVLVRQYY